MRANCLAFPSASISERFLVPCSVRNPQICFGGGLRISGDWDAQAPNTAAGANTSALTHWQASSHACISPRGPGIPKRSPRLPPRHRGLSKWLRNGKGPGKDRAKHFSLLLSLSPPRIYTRPVQRVLCFQSRRRRGAQPLSFTIFHRDEGPLRSWAGTKKGRSSLFGEVIALAHASG